MADFFLDSSAIVKRYVNENGTTFISGLVQLKENTIFIAQIARVEVASAFARRKRGKTLSDNDAARSLANFNADLDDIYFPIIISENLITSATDLAVKHALRGYDAVQLAAALAANFDIISNGGDSLNFISSDNNLNFAAAAEGLNVENPNDYP